MVADPMVRRAQPGYVAAPGPRMSRNHAARDWGSDWSDFWTSRYRDRADSAPREPD